MGRSRATTFSRALSCAAAIVWWCCAGATRAHGPTQVLELLATARSDVLLLTNRGLVFGTLAPRSFAFVCTEAFDVAPGASYRATRFDDGRLLIASTSGLRVSDDGCQFAPQRELGAVPLLALARARGTDVVYTLARGEEGLTLWASSDAGETFRARTTLPPDQHVTSLLVASGAANVLYLSIVRGPVYAPTGHAILRSEDGGETFRTLDLTLLADELDLTLLAVDGDDPRRLVARATARNASRGERVLLSSDGGESFASLGSLRYVLAATFAEDGIYVGGSEGLARVRDDSTGFLAERAGAWLSALERRDQGLFAAGFYAGTDAQLNGVGVWDGSASFVPWMSFSEVRSLRACGSDSAVERACAAALTDFIADNPDRGDITYRLPEEPEPMRTTGFDAGAADASAQGGDPARDSGFDATSEDRDASPTVVDAMVLPADAASVEPSHPSEPATRAPSTPPSLERAEGSGCAASPGSPRGAEWLCSALLPFLAVARRRWSRWRERGRRD